MKAQNDVPVTIRVDKDVKERADILFARLGMDMNTALNVFLHKAVDESAISAKNVDIGSEYSADDITRAFTAVVQNEAYENRCKGFPIARYDADKQQAYLETADGTREYING